MKKLSLTLALIAAVILTACNQADEPTPTSDNENLISNTSSHFISQPDALCIASKVLGNSTRSIGRNFPEVEYVVSKATTRSSNTLSDTLAYVINYPNDGGFVIIASDNRVYPVLGFSNTGSFSFDNEIATTNFISNIEAYLEQADKSASYEVSDSDFDGCYSTAPAIQISLGQVDPWNKYVIKGHPGCVAIATALVMSHSRNDILYHGVNYPLNTIISAIKTGQSKNISQVSDIPKSNNSSKFPIDTVSIGELPFPFEPMYTYEMAVDSMAKIIYHIGKDVGMSYSPSGSGAFSYNA